MPVMSTPRSVELEITAKCNLRCKYCSHFSSEGDVTDELSTEEWLTFFEECRKLGVMDILLSGGEPFLRKDIREIINGIVENRMRFSANSNGTFITDDFAYFLSQTNRCDHIQISIDGHCALIHESCRGENSFENAITGIENLRRYNVPIGIRVTIHQGNVEYLEEIAQFIIEELKFLGFSTNAAMYMGLMRENIDTVQLNTEQYSYAMQTLVDLNKKYNNKINATAGPLADAYYFLEMDRAFKKKAPSFQGCGKLNSCGCANSVIAVRADGVIVPCNQIDGYELGRINKDDLKEIWQNDKKLNEFRDRNKIHLSMFEKCKTCEYINYCRGGCPASVSNVKKSVFVPSTIDCFKTFLENDGKLPDR
ncbi:MAG: SynChlorMet cassette radical SAM/SPASM protein ScmE [Desulfobacteraceae bacterium]|nr:SynChlorMet cassette radical SAM/SPASM protein ScmE [Desulfobacteraceae bacterium]